MKALVLCSGGMKSAFLAIEASKEGEVVLLYLQIGQGLKREVEAVMEIAKWCKAMVSMEEAYVPNEVDPFLRFLLFFAAAVPIAREYKCGIIYHGLCKEDLPRSSQPASAEEFILALQSLLNMSLPWYDSRGHWQEDIQIETPLRRLRLEHVIRLGNEWGIDWAKTWSCTEDGKLHCGMCDKCRRRKQAFGIEKSEDPTLYNHYSRI